MDIKQPYRLVVMLDVDADSLEEAYRKTHGVMTTLCSENKDFEWESTDENYDPSGEAIDPSVMSDCVQRFFEGRKTIP